MQNVVSKTERLLLHVAQTAGGFTPYILNISFWDYPRKLSVGNTLILTRHESLLHPPGSVCLELWGSGTPLASLKLGTCDAKSSILPQAPMWPRPSPAGHSAGGSLHGARPSLLPVPPAEVSSSTGIHTLIALKLFEPTEKVKVGIMTVIWLMSDAPTPRWIRN